MKRESIYLAGLPHTVPTPNAARVGPLFMTGSIQGRDLKSGVIPESPSEQFRLIFENAEQMLADAGGSLDSVAFMEFTVPDRALRSELDPIWVEIFPDEKSRPARHVLAAAAGGIQGRITAFIE